MLGTLESANITHWTHPFQRTIPSVLLPRSRMEAYRISQMLWSVVLEASRSAVVKAQRYESEGRGFETLWGEWLPNPSSRTKPWALLSV
jgi:hypothetical protein